MYSNMDVNTGYTDPFTPAFVFISIFRLYIYNCSLVFISVLPAPCCNTGELHRRERNKMGYILLCAREFYQRRDPLTFYTETKFIQRYRLSKLVVRQLVKNYVAAMPREKRIVRGKHGVPHRVRVSTILCMYPLHS